MGKKGKKKFKTPREELTTLTVAKLKNMPKQCGIVHNKTKKKDIIDILVQFIDLYNTGTRFSRDDYSKVIHGNKGEFFDFDKAKKKADKDILAQCHGWTSRYDSWYIIYSYMVGKTEYAFGWETYYDEIHRGYSDVTAWYDKLQDRTYFTVKYWSKDPKFHYVTAKRFAKLTNPFFVGKKRI